MVLTASYSMLTFWTVSLAGCSEEPVRPTREQLQCAYVRVFMDGKELGVDDDVPTGADLLVRGGVFAAKPAMGGLVVEVSSMHNDRFVIQDSRSSLLNIGAAGQPSTFEVTPKAPSRPGLYLMRFRVGKEVVCERSLKTTLSPIPESN